MTPPFIQPVGTEQQQVESKQPHIQEGVLGNILQELKILRRSQDNGEFSIIRLFAGILQVIVLFCLLVGIWQMTQTPRDSDLVLIALGFAMVLQLMSLTLYLLKQNK